MAQVNIYQYAEIIKSDGTKDRFGSRTVASTISMTGTGEIYHRVYNDIAGESTTVLYDHDLTGVVWFAIKSSVASYVGFAGGSAELGEEQGNNCIKTTANVWQFFNTTSTTEEAADQTLSLRVAGAATAIDQIVIYNPTTADVEIVVAY